MNSAELRGRHLPVFELRGLKCLAEAAHDQGMVQFFLLRKSGNVDRFEARQRLARVFEVVGNRLVRIIADLIVVAVVAHLSGKFRLRAKRVFPLVGEQAIERGSPCFERLFSSRGEKRNEQGEDGKNNHEGCSQVAGPRISKLYIQLFSIYFLSWHAP